MKLTSINGCSVAGCSTSPWHLAVLLWLNMVPERAPAVLAAAEGL